MIYTGMLTRKPGENITLTTYIKEQIMEPTETDLIIWTANNCKRGSPMGFCEVINLRLFYGFFGI
jgi:hypothetical protein